MKNTIMYFYNLEPKDIHQVGKTYRFIIEDSTYLFLPTERAINEVEELYKITTLLKHYHFKMHEIILNNQKKCITVFQNENYVLLRLITSWQEKISLGDILNFNKLSLNFENNKLLLRNDWHKLWSEKIDYFEYQVNQFGKKYPLIRESFSYFCGLAENAIQYTNFIKENQLLCISHKRIKENMLELDFYNPLNIVIDYKVRDITEYFKDRFFNGYLPFEEIEYVLTYELFENEYLVFFTRMLFPSFYFDLYEDIMRGIKKEKEILNIIHKIGQYEILLEKIYMCITNKTKQINFFKPEWL